MAFTCSQIVYSLLMGLLLIAIGIAVNGTTWQVEEHAASNAMGGGGLLGSLFEDLGGGGDGGFGDLGDINFEELMNMDFDGLSIGDGVREPLDMKIEKGLTKARTCSDGDCTAFAIPYEALQTYEKITLAAFCLASTLTLTGWIWSLALGCCNCCKARKALVILAGLAFAALVFGVVYYGAKKDHKLGWTYYVAIGCAAVMLLAVIAGYMAMTPPPTGVYPMQMHQYPPPHHAYPPPAHYPPPNAYQPPPPYGHPIK